MAVESVILIKCWLSVSRTGSGNEFRGADFAEECLQFSLGTTLLGFLKVYVFHSSDFHFSFSFAAWDFY